MGGLSPRVRSALAYSGWLDAGVAVGSTAAGSSGSTAVSATEWQIWQASSCHSHRQRVARCRRRRAGAAVGMPFVAVGHAGMVPMRPRRAGAPAVDEFVSSMAMTSPTQPRTGSRAIIRARRKTRMGE